MKIAFLTSEYPHPKLGLSAGIGSSIKNLAHALVQIGHQVSIIAYHQDKDEVFFDHHIEFYKIKNVKFNGLSWWFTAKKIQKLINNLYNAKKIEILEAPDWTGITAFIKTTCPIVVKLNGSDTFFCNLEQRPVKLWNKIQEKIALKRAQGHIAVSKFVANKTNEVFNMSLNYTIIPNGINPDDFIPNNSISQSEIIILYFGTLIQKKGLFEIPYIFNKIHAQLPIAKLWLIGKDSKDIKTKSSSTWQMMQAMFDTNAIKNVTYFGSLQHPELQKFIPQAQVCIFPSFAEALPLSWLEAMAMQKPIVASDIGWAHEIIFDGKEGFLANPKDHSKFAEKVIQLILNKNLAQKISIASRQKVLLDFEIKKIAKQNIYFYQQVIINK